MLFYFFFSRVDFEFNITIKRNPITQEGNVFMGIPLKQMIKSLLNFSIYNFCLLIQVHLITFRRFFSEAGKKQFKPEIGQCNETSFVRS